MGWLDFTYIQWSIYYSLEGFTFDFFGKWKHNILIEQEIMCMVCFYPFLSNSEKKLENYTIYNVLKGFLVLLFTIILGNRAKNA